MSTSKDHPLLKCETREQLATLLGVSVSTLTYFAYSDGRKYKTFQIAKKSGGSRKITAPVGALKEMQRKLASLLTDIYPGPPYVHGFVPKQSVITNATPHLNRNYVFNIDLNNFFPSITSNRIIGLLRAAPFEFNNQVASAIVGLTCYEGSLPQGAPTSPILSNMICLRMDKSIRRFCKRNQVIYTRYADDLTFSSNTSLPKSIVTTDEDTSYPTPGIWLTNTIDIENDFKINPQKTRLSRGNQAKYVTGIKVNTIPNLPRRYVRQVRNMLHAWERYGLEAAQAEFESKYRGEGRKFINVLWGKLAYLKSIKTEDDLMYARLYNKFVDLEAAGRPKIAEAKIDELHSKVFVVESGSEQGTGFILNKKWLLTCSHVVKKDATDTKFFSYDKWNKFDQLRASPNEESRSPKDNFDMLELLFNENDLDKEDKSFELASEHFVVEVGMEFRVIGFPGYTTGSRPHIIPVKVTAINQYGTYMHAYVGQKLTGGLSGSPVIDSNDRVVGIVQNGENNLSLVNTFLPIQEMRRYILSLDD